MSKRVMIAAPASGSGKTTIVCGLIKAFSDMHLKVVSFKCGPDYIDPIFHTSALGISSYNLDVFLSGETSVKALLAEESQVSDICIIEGVMGFYDGILGEGFKGSSHHISIMTNTPVILVVNCRGKSTSVVAEIKGFMELAPNQIQGVILNGINGEMFAYYKNMINQYLPIEVLGYLPRNEEITIPERKLGLCLEEKQVVKHKLQVLGNTISHTVDLQAILQIADSASRITIADSKPYCNYTVKIAVAKDEAFCFGYVYNRKILRQMGAEIVYFSPLHDKKLPVGIQGIMIGGGYITDYVSQLSNNKSMIKDLREKLSIGMPTIVEGTGNILLTEHFCNEDGINFPFAHCIGNTITQVSKMQNFGYYFIQAKKDNLLCKNDEIIPVHEFHYLLLNNPGDGFTAYKPVRKTSRDCIFASSTLYAGMPYLYFCGNKHIAENFLKACRAFQARASI